MDTSIMTIAIAAILTIGCKSQVANSEQKKEWTWAFKSRVTHTCMCELSNNELQNVLKENGDISFMGEADVLGVRYTNFADSVGRSYARKITPVFPDDSEFAGKKSIFTSCLALYDNKEVNEIIENEYNNFK